MSLQTQEGQSFTALIEGLAAGLVGTLECGIIRQDGTVVVAKTAAQIVEIDPPSGNYQATRTSTESGQLLVEWLDATTGAKYIEDLNVSSAPQPVDVYTGYPDAATLVAGSRVAELTALSPDEQNTLWRQAIGAVEEFTQQSFALTTKTRSVDGSGSEELYLPERLERLDQISARGAWWPGGYWSPDEFAAVDIEVIQLSDDHFRLELNQVIPNYAVQAMDWGDQPYRRTFPSGPDTIAITGAWGWPTVPQPVLDAILLDMEDTALADANQLTSTIRAYRKLGISQIRQGNLSGVLAGDAPLLSLAAQRLVRPYVHPGQMGALA